MWVPFKEPRVQVQEVVAPKTWIMHAGIGVGKVWSAKFL